MPGEVVRIVNVGTNVFRQPFEGQVYEVKPGGTLIVPTEATWVWFGRYFARDTPMHPDRSDEVIRLKFMYGASYSDTPGEPGALTEHEKWDQNAPKVEVYDITTGDQILTVIDDPTGASVSPSSQTEREKELLEEQLANMKAQMEAIQTALAKQQTQNYEPTVEEVAQDEPTQIPVKAGRTR